MDQEQKQEEESDFPVLVHVHVLTREVCGCSILMFSRSIVTLRGRLLQAARGKLQGFQVLNGLLSRRLSIVFPVAYMGLMLIFASVPGSESDLNQTHPLGFLGLVPSLLQNFLHIPAYGVLAFAWRWSLGSYLHYRAAAFIALVLTLGIGVFQEWYQSAAPGRLCSVSDIFFDAIGALLALWVFGCCKK